MFGRQRKTTTIRIDLTVDEAEALVFGASFVLERARLLEQVGRELPQAELDVIRSATGRLNGALREVWRRG